MRQVKANAKANQGVCLIESATKKEAVPSFSDWRILCLFRCFCRVVHIKKQAIHFISFLIIIEGRNVFKNIIKRFLS